MTVTCQKHPRYKGLRVDPKWPCMGCTYVRLFQLLPKGSKQTLYLTDGARLRVTT